jgi:signal transduction histidine kinase
MGRSYSREFDAVDNVVTERAANDGLSLFRTSAAGTARKPFSMRGQVAIFMALASVLPTTLFVGVSYIFFTESKAPLLSFEYWTFLVVAWVVGTAILIARVFSDGLTRQIQPLLHAARDLSEGHAIRPVPVSTRDELGELAQQFNLIESTLAESRQAAIGRIEILEHEIERLRSANELQARFLSAVSHEIRTPLSAIVSSARIIQRYHEKKPEVIDRFGDTIAAEGQRLVRMISDLLDISRLEAGRIVWKDAELRPSRIVRRAVQLNQKSAQLAEVFVDVQASDLLPTIWADEERMIQVLDNLVSNAITASRRGGRVVVSVRQVAEGVCFAVTDGGRGIPADELESIFDKSHTIAEREREGERQAGTGLGLAICREIVDHYGGRIWAECAPEQGAVFQLVLPVNTVARAAAGTETAKPGMRVLMLMKKTVLSEACLRALRLEDIEARICSRFDDVFETMNEWPPQVLIVAPSFVWQLNEHAEAQLRRAGVQHIVMFSQQGGFVEMSPPTHSEPLLARLNQLAPRGSNVLLVEDDKDYGSVIEFELVQAGYTVVKAYNGRDAVESAVEHSPDAMLLDLALPQLDGFGVLEELKIREIDLPVLVLTALEERDLEERLTGLGAVGVFRKYELISPRDSGIVDQVKHILDPVLGDNPTDESSDLSFQDLQASD